MHVTASDRTAQVGTDAPGHVLVVDDEPMLLRGYVRALELCGYVVEGTTNGSAAVSLLNQKSFDVIVADISMPGMDGVQLLRTVRQRDLDVPVVLMTGRPEVETAVHAVEYGALRYLMKPLDTSVLQSVVEQAFRLHRIAKLKREALAIVGEDGAGRLIGENAALDASFNRALEALWMAYQPIVSWSERKVYAYEALLRSSEPALPNPGAILEAAETLGRLPELGRAIRERVAATIPSVPAEYVFINLHSHDLLDDSLYSPSATLTKHAGRVVLEITERAALDDIDDAGARIAALRRLGFRIAVDDLGAGYAGLTSFAQLDPDVVKFDMSLVRGLHTAPKKRRLVQSMTKLFQEMGLLVVAEGVEVAEERAALIECGCDVFQGYLFARPDRSFGEIRW